MLRLLLPLGRRYRSSARVEWISLLKPCYICFDVGKGACWPSKRRWPCRPRWHNAVEDEKSLRWWARRVEHPRRDANATLPLHSAPDKQATSAKHTAQSQETLGNGAGLWSQMENAKKSETLAMMASAIWATTYGPVRNQAQCDAIFFTQSSTPGKEKKKSFSCLSPFIFFKKKTHHDTYRLGF